MAEVVRGYLIVHVEEATGKAKDDGRFTWDTQGRFDGFTKIEIRGGPRPVKAQSKKAPLVGTSITWREEIIMEVLEGAKELRIMLCREKFQGNKRGTSVIAACGIFVNDILEAVPIDKYFELFKPNAGGEGGYMRIGMNFVKDLKQAKASKEAMKSVSSPLPAMGAPSSAGAAKKKGGFPLVPLLAIVLAGAAAAGAAVFAKNKPTSSKPPPPPPAPVKKKGAFW